MGYSSYDFLFWIMKYLNCIPIAINWTIADVNLNLMLLYCMVLLLLLLLLFFALIQFLLDLSERENLHRSVLARWHLCINKVIRRNWKGLQARGERAMNSSLHLCWVGRWAGTLNFIKVSAQVSRSRPDVLMYVRKDQSGFSPYQDLLRIEPILAY